MANGLNLTLTPGTAPFGSQLPSSTQALLDFIAAYMTIAGAGNFNGINFGPNTPAPQNRGNPWFQTDNLGNPIAFNSWNGTAWTPIPIVVPSGASSFRPTSPSPYQEFWDSTIGCLIIWNASVGQWTTASGVPGDIKEVITTTLAQALINNPGWAQETTTIGTVIGGAGSATGIAVAHAQGQQIGEEAHVLVVTELASHTHPEIYGTFTANSFQNGPQASGVYPAVTPGTSSIPLAATGASGGGAGHNNIQPTTYLYRLVKQF